MIVFIGQKVALPNEAATSSSERTADGQTSEINAAPFNAGRASTSTAVARTAVDNGDG